ncbi:hypothetical protein M422DRAFT_271372 [Sphaerobolus stellatus SS14]|uniref:Uncharacterized protein n=1 Tax=Sphaerobolus stellatus (strain SS14) TaxID=990650 RepID=A0A0C9UQ48_SPHS4|nr:hypothetical protein M422DRAFT_271372 [Sphaerobolus stellatus SS14]
MSQASSSGNTAELLLRFGEQQAKHDENHVEVGAVSGACFVYHPKGDEILDQIHEAWPHVSRYITKIDDERATLEKELFQEKSDNHQLCDDLDDLKERIQELETQLSSLQSSNTVSERSTALTSPTDYSPAVGSAHPLSSPIKVTYSCKRSRKLDENADFGNRVLKPEEQPDHWSLHMWQALLGWHKNPMSVPNTIRNDPNSYFLKEDVDIAAWLNKIIADNSCSAFMHRMKSVFGSRFNFETIFSEFDSNLLRPDFQQMQWITDSSMPVRVGSQITKGTKDKAQTTEPVHLPQGAEFLTLLLKHCALSRAQIYDHIIPYMEWDEEKRPMSATGMERAAYMLLHQSAPAPNKGKKLLTGTKAYNNQHEPILPYSEAPPSGEPDVEMHGPPAVGVRGTLPDESTMNVDPEIEDLYE